MEFLLNADAKFLVANSGIDHVPLVKTEDQILYFTPVVEGKL